jgi:hypothetical protein
VELATMGDPMCALLWVSKSHAKLAEALSAMGHKIKKSSILKLLGALQYRRQVNRKTLGGNSHPDRDAQFEHINAAAIATQVAGQPVISIDTKKKELIGPYKNGNRLMPPPIHTPCHYTRPSVRVNNGCWSSSRVNVSIRGCNQRSGIVGIMS